MCQLAILIPALHINLPASVLKKFVSFSFRATSSPGAEEAVALAVKRNGNWIKWSYSQYGENVRSVAKAFIKLGLQPRSDLNPTRCNYKKR